MQVTINGDGSITGLSVGGLPDGCVDADTLASPLANQGITMIDRYSHNSGHGAAFNGVITNWTRGTTSSTQLDANLGTGMSVNSGVFTFPQTGMYLILLHMQVLFQGTADQAVEIRLATTQDNGSDNFATHYTSARTADNTTNLHHYLQANAQAVLDIQNVSNEKFRVETASFAATSQVLGNGTFYASGLHIIRLGDT